MLEHTDLLNLVETLSNRHTVSTCFGRCAYFALYKTQAELTYCPKVGSALTFKPIAIRMLFNQRVKDPTKAGLVLESASLICITRNGVGPMFGRSIQINSLGFTIHGRLRRSKHDKFINPFTQSVHVALSLHSVKTSGYSET